MLYITNILKQFIQRFWQCQRGAIAVYAGISIPVIVLAAGIAVDLGRVQLERQRIGNALDAAGLAAASSANLSTSQREQRMERFFEENYGDNISDITLNMTTSGPNNKNITLTAETEVETTLLAAVDQFFGENYDTLDLAVQSTITRQLQGIEVALVLDITGSMNPFMNDLRTASRDFIDVFYNNIDDPSFGFIGIVPYWTHVSVGPYGICQRPDGSTIPPSECTTFVDLPSGATYTENPDPANPDDWDGLIHARTPPEDTRDSDLATLPLWDVVIDETVVGRRFTSSGTCFDGTCSDPNITCTPQGNTRVGWLNTSSGNCFEFGTPGVCTGPPSLNCAPWSGVWEECTAPVTECRGGEIRTADRTDLRPLTNDESDLKDTIDDLNAGGGTNINIGAAWSWRILSPKNPFSQGKDYSNDKWQKVAVIMTDGQTNSDLAYKPSDRPVDTASRLRETCENMKDQDIIIYTVGYSNAPDESLLKDCASDPDSQHYFSASTGNLDDVFRDISNRISRLHISQ